MKSITLISLFIVFSLSCANEVALTYLVKKFLPKINEELKKPIEAKKSLGKAEASAKINFEELTEENVVAILEKSNLIHLTISNLKAEAEAQFKTKVLGKSINATAKGEIKTTIDMKLEIGTKVSDGKSTLAATITYLKTDSDLSLIFGKVELKLFNKITEPLKKVVQEKIIDKFAQKLLQEKIDKSIDELLKS